MAKKKQESPYTNEQLAAMSPEQVARLSPDDVSKLDAEQITAMSSAQRNALTQEQKDALAKSQAKALDEANAPTEPNPQGVNLAPGYNADLSANQPLREKVPVYGPGSFPTGAGDVGAPPVGHGKTDTRVPPENVTAPVTQEPKPGQEGSSSAAEAYAKTEAGGGGGTSIPTPEQVGLPRPELRAGLAPLPEEDPTPSIVPIPPPGPRRVA